ncbi:hypothetical protein NEIMUCOT_04574 [Neisseria mucosa ATCC 25996]|uniref:Uncharacterized protein n=1 Tax=Neisseria mucosa (strain ATCC 25996 / DSM 4631 / NCTC 10774 / M26) TaxID=546266 RepID=D2ZVD1_NEIM2|nr:hypothetical protein NEIMUCOT_04574 [Neisseria mucosa ATCC 25996]
MFKHKADLKKPSGRLFSRLKCEPYKHRTSFQTTLLNIVD